MRLLMGAQPTHAYIAQVSQRTEVNIEGEPMGEPIVYDKAKYHHDSVRKARLPIKQSEVHTAFFLGWIIDNDLYSKMFAEGPREQELIRQYKARKIAALAVYEWWDTCLIDDMLSSEGNAFAQAYFDFERGKYLSDYQEVLVGDLPSLFHVKYNWENYETIRSRIDDRYDSWKAAETDAG